MAPTWMGFAGGEGDACHLVAVAADGRDFVLDIVNAHLDRLLDQPFDHQRCIVIALSSSVFRLPDSMSSSL